MSSNASAPKFYLSAQIFCQSLCFKFWFRKFSQFSHSVVSDSLWPHESQHARPPCPSPTPRVHLHSRPSSQWYHPAISSSVVPFSSCPQSLPASESFPMSQLFTWGSQSTGVSALASVLPKNTQDWSPLEWTGWISLQSEIRLIIFFVAKDGEALYSQQKQDRELTVVQIMNSLLPNSDLNWRK